MRTIAYVALISASLASTHCADPVQIAPPQNGAESGANHTAAFVGYVYDGVAGARITDYTIQHMVSGEPTTGTVAADGRYALGPFAVFDDYTIIIDANGYRAFLSHNRRPGLPSGISGSDDVADIDSHQTLHYDAYLFPSDQQAPAVTFTINTPLPSEKPEGTLRIRPIAASVLSNDAAEMPVGVNGQQWFNDEDLQGNTLTNDFSQGELSLDSGVLVYGVLYGVDIYGVTGYQPFTGTYVAGVETDKTFTLSEELAQPLEVISSTTNDCEAPDDVATNQAAEFSLTFNHTVEFVDADPARETLDDGLTIVNNNLGDPLLQNTLATMDVSGVQERGVNAVTNGTALTVYWDPSVGLETKDSDDIIQSVIYSNLASVELRRTGSSSAGTAMSTLLGSSSIVCSQ